VLRVSCILVLIALALALPAASAPAATRQEASFQDNALLYNPATLPQTLQTLRSLGVDRLVVSVTWDAVAPRPNSRRAPKGFHAGDPGAYPAANWARYDRIATIAAAYGLGVNFNVAGGAPLWAVKRSPVASLAHVWYPSAAKFGAFVHALGERYSGHYTPRGAAGPLPRVSYWSIWNEPNVGGSSLSPQTVNGIEVGPSIYRSLLDAAWSSLVATGHGPRADTILVGQMASTGHANPGFRLGMQPLRFLRALFCVDSNYRELRGKAAAAESCPTTSSGSRRFPKRNPGLFQATGWGHHPYHLTGAPNRPSRGASEADWVTFADLPRLERALDRVQRDYGSRRRVPLYLTEYGFNTDPPQSYNAVSPSTQAAYLNQAEYIAWRNPRVMTLSQYLLQDARLVRGSGALFSAFTSGLIYHDGVKKPSFAAYRMPIYLPATHAHRRRSLEVWGCVRPGKLNAGHTIAQVQIQLNGTTVRSVPITNSKGYFDVRVVFPKSGTVRLAWTAPDNEGTIYSRNAHIRVH
jgi:hypothetical protein